MSLYNNMSHFSSFQCSLENFNFNLEGSLLGTYAINFSDVENETPFMLCVWVILVTFFIRSGFCALAQGFLNSGTLASEEDYDL